MSSSRSRAACAPCKSMHRKCGNNCVFASLFPPHQLHEFESLQRVYGVSNVEKILRNLPFKKRESALKSLVYEAEAVIRNPVYGVLGIVTILQNTFTQLINDLNKAKKDLTAYERRYPNQHPVNRPSDGAGFSSHATQHTDLTATRAMSPYLALGGSYDSDMGQILLQQEDPPAANLGDRSEEH